jgi:hypothetical protein
MFFSGLARSITFTVAGEGVAVFCSRAVVLHRRDFSLLKETSVEAGVASFRRHLAVFVTNADGEIRSKKEIQAFRQLRERTLCYLAWT